MLTRKGSAIVQMLAGQMVVELLEGEGGAVDGHAGTGAIGHDDLDGGAQVLDLGLGNVGHDEANIGGREQRELVVGHVDGALGAAGGAGHVGHRVEGQPVERALGGGGEGTCCQQDDDDDDDDGRTKR